VQDYTFERTSTLRHNTRRVVIYEEIPAQRQRECGGFPRNLPETGGREILMKFTKGDRLEFKKTITHLDIVTDR
jgi:hypothetical protein